MLDTVATLDVRAMLRAAVQAEPDRTDFEQWADDWLTSLAAGQVHEAARQLAAVALRDAAREHAHEIERRAFRDMLGPMHGIPRETWLAMSDAERDQVQQDRRQQREADEAAAEQAEADRQAEARRRDDFRRRCFYSKRLDRIRVTDPGATETRDLTPAEAKLVGADAWAQSERELTAQLAEIDRRARQDIGRVFEQIRQETRLQVTAELLASTFALGDGTRVTWGEATVAQHEQRAELLLAQAGGTVKTAARHGAAVERIKVAGVTCLAELTE